MDLLYLVMLVAAVALLALRIRADWRAWDKHSRLMRVLAAQVLLVLIGLAMGVWHFRLAWVSMFVFRNDEPMSSWVWVYSGLMSTLPLMVLSIWRPRWAAVGLLLGSAVAASALVAGDWPQWREHAPGFLITSAGPAAIMAAGMAVVAHQRDRTFMKRT